MVESGPYTSCVESFYDDITDHKNHSSLPNSRTTHTTKGHFLLICGARCLEYRALLTVINCSI